MRGPTRMTLETATSNTVEIVIPEIHNDPLANLHLVKGDDAVLHAAVPTFDFSNPPYDPVKLYEKVGALMLKWNGLGLSCNQVGISARMFTVRGTDVIPFFNPLIVWESKETTVMQEGCLSYPFLFLKVTRPAEVRVRFADPTGKVQTQHFAGMTARVVQHEVDHLNGVVFVDKVKDFALSLAKERAKKLMKSSGHLTPVAYSM